MPARKRSAAPVARESPGLGTDRLRRLRDLYPEAFVEGKLDLERLRAALGAAIDPAPERYALTWAGKQDALRLAQQPTRATLLPAPEESAGFAQAENLFIAGDNLEVLKLLYRPYGGQVKLIYIDPPYNTGQDFIYRDDFTDPLAAYLRRTGQQDGAGNWLTSNPETGGRYHSAWLSMMYPRLLLARQLLREDGFIFVSIGDAEVANLTLLMNEIFGEENFVASICWRRRRSQANLSRDIAVIHDHILCYKRSPAARLGRVPAPLDRLAFGNPDSDPRGPYTTMPCSNRGGARYEIVTPTGRRYVGEWRFKPDTFRRLLAAGRIVFPDGGNGKPRYKLYLSEKQAEGAIANTWWDDAGANQDGTREFQALFGDEVRFQSPKPVALIRRMLQIATQPREGALVLDFFAGSCTTALAVMEQNRADGGNRRWIMVQIPEPTGHPRFPHIAAIGMERIRRYLSVQGSPPDLGFRVFRLAASHFRPWPEPAPQTPEEYAAELEAHLDPLLPGWTPEGVVWEVALREGCRPDARLERVTAAGLTLWRVADGRAGLYVCLDERIPAAAAAGLPLGPEDTFVCRDLALDDAAAALLAGRCRLKTI